jgi:hypothetical protein
MAVVVDPSLDRSGIFLLVVLAIILKFGAVFLGQMPFLTPTTVIGSGPIQAAFTTAKEPHPPSKPNTSFSCYTTLGELLLDLIDMFIILFKLF